MHNGERTVSGGHGFAGIGRKTMLVLLQARARELGVDLQFETEFKSVGGVPDGLRSGGGDRWHQLAGAAGICEVFQPDIDTRKCKFVWLGTHAKFDDAFTFIFEKTEHGWVWAHVYQFDEDTATFIVECLPETWDKLGFQDDVEGGHHCDL